MSNATINCDNSNKCKAKKKVKSKNKYATFSTTATCPCHVDAAQHSGFFMSVYCQHFYWPLQACRQCNAKSNCDGTYLNTNTEMCVRVYDYQWMSAQMCDGHLDIIDLIECFWILKHMRGLSLTCRTRSMYLCMCEYIDTPYVCESLCALAKLHKKGLPWQWVCRYNCLRRRFSASNG